MTIAERLRTRSAGRDALLDRMTIQVASDSRIVAAWLFGSLGRRSADELSDIDIWLVVADEAIDAMAAARFDYVAQTEAPLMVYDGRQNAPMGGAYLMALYSGTDGPYQVDWYWQPRSSARRPRQASVLFDRVGIPAAAPLPGPLEAREPQSPEERAARVTQEVSFFWVMANIAAKNIARRKSWDSVGTLSMLEDIKQRVRWLIGDQSEHPGFGPERSTAPPVQPFEQMALLRQLAEEMAQLNPQIEQAGGKVPFNAIPPIHQFFALTSEMINEDTTLRNEEDR
ncbi:MAG: nucleotidyltransferase domain-containing protein [Chloroflexota bacterium]